MRSATATRRTTPGAHGGARHTGPTGPHNTPTTEQEGHHDADPGGWMPASPWPAHTQPRRNLPGLDFYEGGGNPA